MEGNQGVSHIEMSTMQSGFPESYTQSHDFHHPTGKKIVLPPISNPPVPCTTESTTNAEKDRTKPEVTSGVSSRGPDNSLLSFLGNLGIVILCIINILSLLLGIGLVVAGSYVNKELNKEDEIMDLLDKVDFGSFTLKQLILTVIVVIIVVGVFAIITSLIGGCGAFFTLRVLLIVYIIFVILCMILEISILGLWIDFLNEIDSTLRGWFNTLLKKYRGPGVANLYSIGWDLIFVVFGCCGVEPVTFSNNDFQTLPTEWWTTGDHGNNSIPYSCCQNVPVDSIRNYLNYTDVPCTENFINYNTSGCYDFFDEIFTKLATVAITITVILFLVEIAAVVFGFIIVCAVTAKKKIGIV